MDKSGKGQQANEASNKVNEQIQGPKTIPRTLLRIPITHICLKKMKNSLYTVMGIGITVRGQAREAIKDVGRAVRVHKWQVNREINLRFFEIKDEDLTTLGPHVSGHLHQMKKISFDFIWCGTISDKAVEMIISEPARHLKQLKTLFLNFYACGQITDNGINILMSNITNCLPNINQLFLRLQACRQITDRGLEILSVGLARRLTQLDQLYLDFSWCTQITDKGLEILGSQIANMKQLRYLKLSFQATSQITDKGADALGLGIATGPTQLKKLELDFFNTLLTQEMVQKLKNILSFVVDLRIDSQY